MSKLLIRVKLSITTTYGVALLIIFGVALFIRTYFPHENVFAGDWVRFQLNDPWVHMRQVENLVHHFPYRMPFDPYMIHPLDINPGAIGVGIAPLFDMLLGFFIWAIGIGSPSKQIIDTVGAYFPAILGALLTIPVYFIGKELFNRKAGILAAALIAILPGQFLMRSLLGFTDHHVAEVLFSTLTMLFLLMAVRSSNQKALSFIALWRRDWRSMKKPLFYSVLAGIALGCYLLSWSGGGLFVFVIFIYVVVQYIVDHLRGRATDYLCIISISTFLIALLTIGPASGQYSEGNLQVSSLIIGILALLVLGGLSTVMARWEMRKAYYPLALGVLGSIGWLAINLIDPSLLNSILDKLTSVFAPTAGLQTTAEVKPLFYPYDSFSWSPAWNNFTTGFYLALISLVIMVYFVIKKGEADKTLLLVWSVLILAATLAQNRFAYYFAVNVAILSAYFSWRILEFCGFREASEGIPREGDDRKELAVETTISRKEKRRKARAQRRERGAPVITYLRAKYVYGVIAIVFVFFLAFYPNIGVSINYARAERGATDDWHDALIWMKGNTIEPFDDPEFYYELYERPAAGEWYHPPESAYGIMSWWDYGYWISYISHRIPNANPGQGEGARNAGLFLTAQDESSANEVLNRLGSKYVIIDNLMSIPKFYAMATYAGFEVTEMFGVKVPTDFWDIYFEDTGGGKLRPVRLFYPEYYQSMVSRLYNFSGRKWDPYDDWIKDSWDDEIEGYRDKINVIDYEVSKDGKGNENKIITDVKTFTRYEMAKAFVETNPNYKIIGTNPFLSPVPLEELVHYKLIYKSPTTVQSGGEKTISEVEIFEYSP